MTFFQRLKNDFIFLRGAMRSLRMAKPIAEHPTRIFPNLIEELAERFDDKVALISERETFTYRELAERSYRYTRWALAQQLEKDEVVCLLMPNRPEYLAIWIGLTRAGAVVALLNTHLTGSSLAHCIDIVNPRHVIVAAELFEAIRMVMPMLRTAPMLWQHGGARAAVPRIDQAIDALSPAPLAPSERRALSIEDRALYIYTSGTTGLPKAANVNHYRVMLASLGFCGVMNTRSSDRLYDCLPMYHTVGGVVAPGALLVAGGSVVIREKFSVHGFWNDIARTECTILQYIGELCRYLVNAPPQPHETDHRLRLACGNGLRPDIWNAFKERFSIPAILEFYAATEGNVTLFNFEGRPGSIGRIPWFVARHFPVSVVRFDVEKEVPVRDAHGFCIRCAPDEVGETLGKILNDPRAPASRFEGYAQEGDNEKKILRDVFEKGDAWFRTGDLMRQDKDGYFYFVDRIGDTFRWKGENVSTTEVAEVLNGFDDISHANVYGVRVPGYDGRAGMAAISCPHDLDLAALHAYLTRELPPYARPLFLRIRAEIEMTATFKEKKIDLVKQAFDPTVTEDALYFNDPETRSFRRIDPALYARIVSGKVRL